MFVDNEDGKLLHAPAQRTLSDYVVDQLRQAIVTNQLKPGQRLVEQEIAESMQTSRGPVRDALKILETEGLVVRQSHRSAFVARLTRDDIEEVYTLRKALESLAIRYAIKNATDEQLDELEQLVKQMESLNDASENIQSEATELDIQFHRGICVLSQHKRVLTAWDAISAQIRLIILSHRLLNPEDLREKALLWHLYIIDALRKRDVEMALQELVKHLDVSFSSIVSSLERE